MPRVLRNYEYENFSYLLENNECDETENKKSEKIINIISEEKRNRDHLMSNHNNLYVYSSKNHILHDRSCDNVKDISDKNFRMTSDIKLYKNKCKECYHKMIIRKAIGTDQRKIGAYEIIITKMGILNKQLENLVVENNAKFKIIDTKTLDITLNEDTWRIILEEKGLQLLHNNYAVSVLEERVKTGGFHVQIGKKLRFSTIYKLITEYSWEEFHKNIKNDVISDEDIEL